MIDQRARTSFTIQTVPETFYHVQGAQTVWASPKITVSSCFGGSTRRSRLEEIARRLAVLSRPYLHDTEVCKAAPTSGTTALGSRPQYYQRAALIDHNETTFEVKGCGVPDKSEPRDAPYKDGLYHIHNAVYEVFCEKIARQSIAALPEIKTQPSLAIIRLPIQFNLGSTHRIPIPAAAYIREPSYAFSIDDLTGVTSERETGLSRITIEMELRKCGITSCNPFERLRFLSKTTEPTCFRGNQKLQGKDLEVALAILQDAGCTPPIEIDMLNVQLAYSPYRNAIFLKDFEHYNSQSEFKWPLIALSKKTGCQFLRTGAPGFVRCPEKKSLFNEFTTYVEISHFIDELKKFSPTMVTTPVHYYVLAHRNCKDLPGKIKDLLRVADGRAPNARLAKFLEKFNKCRVF